MFLAVCKFSPKYMTVISTTNYIIIECSLLFVNVQSLCANRV